MIDLTGDERARSFRLGGGDKGCLLLHGFTGTPAEMRPIGEALAARGFTVIAPLLPGHGTRVEELAPTRWEDWYASALEAWEALAPRARVVAGLSMGGLLALHLAHDRAPEVRAVAALAPVLRLRNQRAAEQALWISRMPLLPRRVAIVRKDGTAAPEPSRKTPSYDEVPLRALGSMIRLQRLVALELPEIVAPVLIVEGGRDRTIAPEAGAAIESALGSARKRRILFPESAHILTEEPDAAEVVAAVEEFFAEALGV
ncbi:MAG: alpha/beta hydrolase [Candidatus Binatia bacterium]